MYDSTLILSRPCEDPRTDEAAPDEDARKKGWDKEDEEDEEGEGARVMVVEEEDRLTGVEVALAGAEGEPAGGDGGRPANESERAAEERRGEAAGGG